MEPVIDKSQRGKRTYTCINAWYSRLSGTGPSVGNLEEVNVSAGRDGYKMGAGLTLTMKTELATVD